MNSVSTTSPYEFPFKKQLMLLAVIIVAAAAVYSPALTHSFNAYDDRGFIHHNRFVVNEVFSLSELLQSSPQGVYEPMTTLVNRLIYQLFGPNAFIFHLVSILLFCINMALLFCLLRKLRIDSAVILITLMLFAFHPVQVESVAWISSKNDLQSITFLLLALLAYVASIQGEGPRRWVWYIASFLLSVPALLSKNNMIMIPGVLLAIEWFFGGFNKGSMKKTILRLLPFSILAGCCCILFLKMAMGSGLVGEAETILPERLLTNWAFVSEIYLTNIFVPLWIYPDYYQDIGWIGIRWGHIVSTVGCMLFIFAVAKIKTANLRRQIIAMAGIFTLPYMPYANIVDIDLVAADHYFHFTSIFVYYLLACAAWQLLKKHGNHAVVFCLVVSSILMIMTSKQIALWGEPLPLWQQTLQKYPLSAKAAFNVGVGLDKQGKLEEAKAIYVKALENHPGDRYIRFNYASIMIKQGNCKEALKHLERLYRYGLDDYRLTYYLGICNEKLGKIKSAEEWFIQSARMKSVASTWLNLGLIYAHQQQYGKAAEAWLRGIDLEPNNLKLLFNLSAAYGRAGKKGKAKQYGERFIKLCPECKEAKLLKRLLDANR